MIVSEDNVSTALRYLAQDPHPLALAKKDLRDAERAKDQAYAKAFVHAMGSVENKKAQAEIATADFSETVAQAEMEEQRHKARMHAADMLIEVWRSEQANVRAAEKIR